jgi:hypothetical protein
VLQTGRRGVRPHVDARHVDAAGGCGEHSAGDATLGGLRPARVSAGRRAQAAYLQRQPQTGGAAGSPPDPPTRGSAISRAFVPRDQFRAAQPRGYRSRHQRDGADDGRGRGQLWLQHALAGKQAERQSVHEGKSMRGWAEILARRTEIQQFFCRESGEAHNPRPDSEKTWGEIWQNDWQANAKCMRGQTIRICAMEFLLRRGHSMETLGMAEVVYPGLEACAPPVMDLFSAAEHDALVALWPGYLASLCDLVRTRGCITLGEEDDDQNAELSGWELDEP